MCRRLAKGDISGDFGINLIVLLGLRAPLRAWSWQLSEPTRPEESECCQLATCRLVKMSKALYPQDKGSKKWADLEILDNGHNQLG